MFEPDPLVLGSQVFSRAADVIVMVGLTRDAWDAKEVLELAKAELARLFEKLLGRAQASR